MVLLNYIQEFEGIIGAVLGSVSTLIVTDFLRHRGKLNVYIVNKEYNFDTYKSVGCYSNGSEDNDLYGFRLKYTLQVYNSFDVPQIMRNFQIRFYTNDKLIVQEIPRDETTKVYAAHSIHVNEVGVVNINSREAVQLEQSIYLNVEEFQTDHFNKIDLCYLNDKNKLMTIRLYNYTIAFSQSEKIENTP
ncbi:hypothetical protein [Sinanaerobacter chloroacetimidivorans]|uniref:Uncharacterized protein n=1 Tax=Sinanaerobacter chloroacetimidivorans TaxID=2818044 RepID=A0A8J7W465_9FIRM|nr:hypothetical protein [Sinanaerobacter chloroacetimidivorans]MBR0599023.1 hypothetical protein [Sinanaerobacter chloroacetimidivorans]